MFARFIQLGGWMLVRRVLLCALILPLGWVAFWLLYWSGCPPGDPHNVRYLLWTWHLATIDQRDARASWAIRATTYGADWDLVVGKTLPEVEALFGSVKDPALQNEQERACAREFHVDPGQVFWIADTDVGAVVQQGRVRTLLIYNHCFQ